MALDDVMQRLNVWLADTHVRNSITERVRLYERFAHFAAHKISNDEALARMIARLTRRPPSGLGPKMIHVYRRWLAGLRRGMRFTDPEVAGNDLPASERVMLMMGDETSDPTEGFRQARYVADVVRRMKSALMSELLYPAVLMLLGGGFLAAIGFWVGPQLDKMTDKPVETWPMPSRWLFWLGELTNSYGVIAAVVLVVAAILAIYSLPRWSERFPRLRQFCDHNIPPWSIYREYTASTFLIALGAMVMVNAPIDVAIARIAGISGDWAQRHMRLILARIRRGDPPGQAFDTGLLSDEALGYIEDFDSAGSLETALTVVGRETVEDAIARLRQGAAVMRLIAMVLVTFLILLIYGGMAAIGLMTYQDSRSSL